MPPNSPADFLGDSYDLVKRFFILALQALGYAVAIDPMVTGDWMGGEQDFHRLLGLLSNRPPKDKTLQHCLFLDLRPGQNLAQR